MHRHPQIAKYCESNIFHPVPLPHVVGIARRRRVQAVRTTMNERTKKLPLANGSPMKKKTVSLVGRPYPLEEHVLLQAGQLYFLLPKTWTLNVVVSEDTLETWTCMKDRWNAPLRLNKNGDVECFTANTKDCVVTRKRACSNLLSVIKKISSGKKHVLTCGGDHMTKWHVSGYDSPVHWCHEARAAFLKAKTGTITCSRTGKVLASGRFVVKYPQYFKVTHTTPAFQAALCSLSTTRRTL